MFAPIHIQSNFHITLSSKPYLPTIKLKSFLLNYKGCSIFSMFGIGRNWKVISHGVANKKSEAIITSNIQLFAIDQRTWNENEVYKYIYGWNEDGSDEGSLLAEMLQVDGRRLVVNYESRAHIFGRSAKFFGARKIENENYRRWFHSTKVLCKAQLVDWSAHCKRIIKANKM